MDLSLSGQSRRDALRPRPRDGRSGSGIAMVAIESKTIEQDGPTYRGQLGSAIGYRLPIKSW
jgi:hypothetical protein